MCYKNEQTSMNAKEEKVTGYVLGNYLERFPLKSPDYIKLFWELQAEHGVPWALFNYY